MLISAYLANTALQPLTRSTMEETCGPLMMIDVTLAAELVGKELAAELAGLDVVGLDGDVRSGGRDVDRDHEDAGVLRALDGGAAGLRVGGVEQDQVHTRGDEAVDLGELLVQLIIGLGLVEIHRELTTAEQG